MTNVEALKTLAIAINKDIDVDGANTIVEVLNIIAGAYSGENTAVCTADAIVNIASVISNIIPEIKLQNRTVTPTTSQQTITAPSNYDGLGTVTVSAVTAAIDSNITAENIKSGVAILGVTGSYTGE